MSHSARRAVWRLGRKFLQRGRAYVGAIALTIFIILAFNGAKTLQTYQVKRIVDGLPQMSDMAPLAPIAYLVFGLSVALFAFGSLRDYLTNWLTKRLIADVRNEVTEHMSYLPLRYHHDRKSGDLISRVTNDITVMEPAATFFYDDILVHPTMILYAIGLILYTNWMLAAIILVSFPLYVIPLVRLGKRMRQVRRQSLESLGEMTQTMVQTLGGIKVVKAFNMEAVQIEEFRQHNESFFRRFMGVVWRKAIGENLSHIFIGVAVLAIFLGGGFLLMKKMMTAGDVATFALGIAMINSSTRELSKSYNRLLEASAGCDRIFDLLDVPRDTKHEEGEELESVAAGVRFEGVNFSYDTEPVLRDIDLKISPGEVVALVGRSGAGKTTLCDLLCRFYDPTSGRITVGGRDISRLKRSNLLRHVAMVTQETFLFHASIGDNIRYSRPDADRAAVEAAAKAANIHEFISGLEKGYDTVIGDRGAKLSGGQRQRISIARAILKDPDILILDEATSALDTENEKLVQQALQELIRSGQKRRITLVIAHRLSTVRDADRIVVLDGGRIVEEGPHDALLGREGAYAGLYRTQFAS